ncbi:hypothetical protein PAJ34TS1_28570 [Paenibacillus azoreducens]
MLKSLRKEPYSWQLYTKIALGIKNGLKGTLYAYDRLLNGHNGRYLPKNSRFQILTVTTALILLKTTLKRGFFTK